MPPACVPVSPTSAKPPRTSTVELTDHAAAGTQKKRCLIMVYIKLNVILNIGLQIPDDLFAAGQLLSVPARVRVPLCQTTESKSLSQPKESIQCPPP